MNKYTGKSVFGGIAIGKIMVYEKGEHQVKRVKITDAEAEKNRYYEAVEIAFKQLGDPMKGHSTISVQELTQDTHSSRRSKICT